MNHPWWRINGSNGRSLKKSSSFLLQNIPMVFLHFNTNDKTVGVEEKMNDEVVVRTWITKFLLSQSKNIWILQLVLDIILSRTVEKLI